MRVICSALVIGAAICSKSASGFGVPNSALLALQKNVAPFFPRQGGVATSSRTGAESTISLTDDKRLSLVRERKHYFFSIIVSCHSSEMSDTCALNLPLIPLSRLLTAKQLQVAVAVRNLPDSVLISLF
jgi:hypothetical protein